MTAAMEEETQAKEQATFTQVHSLRPGTSGHNLKVKVVSSKPVVNRSKGDGTKVRVNECVVGDDTGVVVFTAKNDQVDKLTQGKTLTLRNAKIEMYRGCIRLIVDKWGLVEEETDGVEIQPKEDNNLSEVEYELISIPDTK
jgi:replication factor A1